MTAPRSEAVESSELAEKFPLVDGFSARRRSGLIGLGASSSGQHARDADAMLADGFGRD